MGSQEDSNIKSQQSHLPNLEFPSIMIVFGRRTCEDVVSYLSNWKNLLCIADFQNPNICGFVGENEGVHTDRPVSGTLRNCPTIDVED